MAKCPECKSNDCKRFYCEFRLHEIVIGTIIAVLCYKNLFSFMPQELGSYFVCIFVGIIVVVRVLFPFILNLKFPKYKCKDCGNIFEKDNDEEIVQ